jgi:cell division protein FtsB
VRGTARSTTRDTTTTRIESRGGRSTPPRTPGATRGTDGARSSNRPAAARRAAAGATKRTVAVRPRRLTGRASVLLVVLAALAMAYTYPVRDYLDQESRIAQMQAAQEQQRAVIAGKAEEVAKWQDDEYFRAIARREQYWVRPGEVPLVVFDDPEGAARDAGLPAPSAAPDRWYDTLFSSVAAANIEPRS